MAVALRVAACALGLSACLPGCRSPAGSSAGTGLPQRDTVAAQRLNEQGLQLIAGGRFSEARAELEKALQADPFFGPAHCNLAVALLHEGRAYDAGWELQAACRLMPKAAQPRANLALLYEAVGRYADAEGQLRAALALAPEDIEIIGQLARVQVRQSKRTAETVAWLETVATQDDDPTWRAWARRQLVTGFKER